MRNAIWRWRARRAVKPLFDEQEAAEERVATGPEEWVSWWRATGQRELRCILMTAWDPIGVGDVVEAWGEYDSYEAGVASRLRDAANDDDAARQVADYLDHVERDFMGNELTKKRRRENRFLADALVAWHEWSLASVAGARGEPYGPRAPE